jgi:hypothetical protein
MPHQKPRSGESLQPTAQAVGKIANGQSPSGAKDWCNILDKTTFREG